MSEHLNAVVALSGDFSPDLTEIGPGTQERMDAAIAMVETADVPLVVSGNYPFRWRKPPPQPLAYLMRDYALSQGIPGSMVVLQAESLETIGDALFTKERVTEPRDWRNLAVVTSDAHLPRSHRVFAHVMGPRYTIEGVAAGAAEEVKLQKAQELIGNVLVHAVLNGTEPGDTEAIRARLFGVIPGYSEVPTLSRVWGLATGLLGR